MSKTEAVTELEGQLVTLRSALETASTDVNVNKALMEQISQEKSSLEGQLRETKDVLARLESDHQNDESLLSSLRVDVRHSYIQS